MDVKVSWTAKEIRLVNPKRNRSWISIGSTDAEILELWPPDAKMQLRRKGPDAGKYWGQEEKGATENEFVGLHHQLSGREFEQTPGDSEGQESLAQFMGLQRVRWLSNWVTATVWKGGRWLHQGAEAVWHTKIKTPHEGCSGCCDSNGLEERRRAEQRDAR